MKRIKESNVFEMFLTFTNTPSHWSNNTVAFKHNHDYAKCKLYESSLCINTTAVHTIGLD